MLMPRYLMIIHGLKKHTRLAGLFEDHFAHIQNLKQCRQGRIQYTWARSSPCSPRPFVAQASDSQPLPQNDEADHGPSVLGPETNIKCSLPGCCPQNNSLGCPACICKLYTASLWWVLEVDLYADFYCQLAISGRWAGGGSTAYIFLLLYFSLHTFPRLKTEVREKTR